MTFDSLPPTQQLALGHAHTAPLVRAAGGFRGQGVVHTVRCCNVLLRNRVIEFADDERRTLRITAAGREVIEQARCAEQAAAA